jgi:transposase
LIAERVQHVNRIKGLLFSQGVGDYEPLRRDRRRALETLRTGDGRNLERHLKAQIGRELDRLELLMGQIAAVEGVRDAMLSAAVEAEAAQAPQGAPAPVRMLANVRSIGPEFAAILWTEGSADRSPIAGRSPLWAAWRRRLGRAGRSIMNRAYRKRGIRACARR